MYHVLGAARVGGGGGVGGGLCRWPSSGGVNLIIEIKSCLKNCLKIVCEICLIQNSQPKDTNGKEI